MTIYWSTLWEAEVVGRLEADDSLTFIRKSGSEYNMKLWTQKDAERYVERGTWQKLEVP